MRDNLHIGPSVGRFWYKCGGGGAQERHQKRLKSTNRAASRAALGVDRFDGPLRRLGVAAPLSYRPEAFLASALMRVGLITSYGSHRRPWELAVVCRASVGATFASSSSPMYTPMNSGQ